MKKTISLVVVVALIMSLAITAFAAPRAPESSECDHAWEITKTTTAWKYSSDTMCQRTVTQTKKCAKCGIAGTTDVTIDFPPHEETIVSATCDGTTQTHTYRCTNCKGYLPKKYVPCIGAGKNHASGCMWLPI